jgi:hypothetical protein
LHIEQILRFQDFPVLSDLIEERARIAESLEGRRSFLLQEPFGLRGFALSAQDLREIGQGKHCGKQGASELGAHTTLKQVADRIELERLQDAIGGD